MSNANVSVVVPAPEIAPALVSETAAVIQMIERAARDPSVDLDKMERLMLMKERNDARLAKQAFAAALADMQEHLPVIEERGKIDIGKGKPQSYALWEDINEAIKPVLSKFGFALSFRTGREGDKIIVTGILLHRAGHSEETTMHLPIDGSGSKNAVQSVGSSTSYGKRYTAGALLNLTSRIREDRDDDGKASGAATTINEDELAALNNLIAETDTDIGAFCKVCKVDFLAELTIEKFPAAIAKLQAKKARMAAISG
jgi:hypothetical protein